MVETIKKNNYVLKRIITGKKTFILPCKIICQRGRSKSKTFLTDDNNQNMTLQCFYLKRRKK